MTSVIATTRSRRQFHRQTANLRPFSTRGGVLLEAPYEDNDSGSSISSSMVVERIARSLGDDSATYVVPDDATADILSAI